MSWGTLYFYYRCPVCGEKFKYDYSRSDEFGADFGICPDCGAAGDFVKDGPRQPDDSDYPEVD
ncbi:MAG: excinuclease ATPase subunit [Clostridiales Family XIII bacterium]|jgi:predicted RNA-binding Zn-ribbon protein involved in translation (DUF1610 family)|nr:excinuclease ATPase subunit [Clostridiales Family XIII bacterium]